MFYDYRISAIVVLVGTVVVLAVFSMPPLTSGGNMRSTGVSEATFDAAVSQELAYCQTQPKALDCQCFANRSSIILTYRQPKVPGVTYSDRRALARGQAEDAC